MGVVVRSCNCFSLFQDREYGRGQRVCNVSAKGSSCTVCGRDNLKPVVTKKEEADEPKRKKGKKK